MRQLLYIVGPPGVGKTTALASALAGVLVAECSQPFSRQLYLALDGSVRGAQLGAARRGFAGTDALPADVQPRVERWLADCELPFVVGEGDRLANTRFFREVRRLGWALSVVHLAAWWSVCHSRRLARAAELGERLPSDEWLWRRHARSALLAQEFTSPEWCLNGVCSPEVVAARLREHPVIRGLRGGA